MIPRGVDQTDVIFDFYFSPDSSASAEFVERSLRASDTIQGEDTDVCERVQAGLRSSAYDRGRYAPRFERGAHLFHTLLHADFAAGLR